MTKLLSHVVFQKIVEKHVFLYDTRHSLSHFGGGL